ncbi:Os05g0379300, partial [Oryza sativa Japonica Group]
HQEPRRRARRPRRRGGGGAPSPRPSSAGCYTFVRSASRRGGYRRLGSSASVSTATDVIWVVVGTTKRERSLFHVDPAVLEAGLVQRVTPRFSVGIKNHLIMHFL